MGGFSKILLRHSGQTSKVVKYGCFLKYTWIHEIETIPDGIWQQYEGPQIGF